PAGNVVLTVDSTRLGPQALVGGSTVFSLTTPSAGDHNLTAAYAAQGNFGGSSASGLLHVNAAPTTTNVVPANVTFPRNAPVIVTVASVAGVPSGAVTLSVDGGAATTQVLVNRASTF